MIETIGAVDNVTHSLAGMLVAELWLSFGKPRPMTVRTAAYATSIVANNLPDADFAYMWITGGQLGYLLHHRGHTHTFAAVLPLALLTLGAVAGVAKLRRRHPSGGEGSIREQPQSGVTRDHARLLIGLALLGPLLHLLMDLGNSYGVHPFWPFDNRWYYGDTLFIIEPLLFAVAIPTLLPALRSRWARGVLAFVLVAMLAACWFLDLVPVPLAALVTVLSAIAAVISVRSSSRVRATTGAVLFIACTLAFAGVSRSVKGRLSAFLSASFPDAQSLDLVITPMPANPLCYDVLAVQRSGQNYLVRKLAFAPLPSLLKAADCPQFREQSTAPLLPIDRPATPAVVFRGQFVAPLGELEALSHHCEARAFLRFGRVPYWIREDTGGSVIGDLRYDRTPGLDFADVRLTSGPCPERVPNWTPPRHDVLGASSW